MHYFLFGYSVSTFQPPGGSDNLWNLVAVIGGQDDSLLPQNYCKGIMHLKHLIKFRMVSKVCKDDVLKQKLVSPFLVEIQKLF